MTIEEVHDDDKISGAMVVTRSGKMKGDNVQKKGEQQPVDWMTQDHIKMGVLKEINRAKNQ